MHRTPPTDEGAQTPAPGHWSPHTLRDALQPGDRFLGPSGRIWTVKTITARGNRIVLTTPTPDGDGAAIVDHLAVARMIPLPIAPSSPDDTAATPGLKPAHWSHRDANSDEQRPQAIPAIAAGVPPHDDDVKQAVTP